MIALELLAQAAIMAVVALGAWVAMGEGMVMSWFRKLVEKEGGFRVSFARHEKPAVRIVKVEKRPILPSWIRNPIASCPRCMCSAWGIAALIICGFGVGISWNFELHILAIDWQRVAQLPVLILAAVGIQEMLHKP